LLCVGGGSGGHVTPVLAVINRLAEIDDELQVLFVCDSAFESQARGLMKHAAVPVKVKTVSAGKLRRYHDESLLQKMIDLKTNSKNARDIFRVGVGFMQSLKIMRDYSPDIVFAKGGYVCLPVGLAAQSLHIPLVLHDSDARPGLTNKVLSRFAAGIATGTPLKNYNYNPGISTYTGVPVGPEFIKFSKKEQSDAKKKLGFDIKRPLVVGVGGGLGAMSINKAFVSAGHTLVQKGCSLLLVSGRAHADEIRRQMPESQHIRVESFVYSDMHELLGAADVVVTRASATFLQELSALAKPCIVVPAAQLGDQVKNAEVFAAAKAVVVMSDREIVQNENFTKQVIDLVDSTQKRQQLAKNFHSFAKPNAAKDVADMIYEVTRRGL